MDDVTTLSGTRGALIRGQASDLFHDLQLPFGLGCECDGVPDNWGRLDLQIRLIADQLALAGEEIQQGSNDSSSAVPLYRVAGEPSAHSDEIQVAYNNFRPGPNKPFIPCSSRQAVFYQLESPGRFEANHPESQKVIPGVTKSFRETLRNIVFLDARPAVMRGYSYDKDNQMKEDGSNLSSVLFRICRQSEHGRSKLLEFIRSLPEQNIVDIRFIETDRRDVMVRLVESFGGQNRDVDAPLLSDGTLRVLAVAAVLLSAPPGSLVVIEELDNGVHPSRAENLVRQIRATATERNLQILLTTHNPALLDALPNDCLEDVLCCYRDPDSGESRVTRLGDLDRYPELVAQASLGELVTQRILDRFLKDRTSETERLQQMHLWLEELEQETEA
ncbi:MAG UNVERIFIED_CONTAM: ATP-binding protein [Planctomycetaceae bacterium]